MSVEKNIAKKSKPSAPLVVSATLAAPINHRSAVETILSKQLDELLCGDDVPTDWQSKRFFFHIFSGESGELVYCVVDGARLTSFQYRILFAIQLQVEIDYSGAERVLEQYVASWFYEPERVKRLKTEFAHERDITWDGELAGCLFAYHADLPEPEQAYVVVDVDF